MGEENSAIFKLIKGEVERLDECLLRAEDAIRRHEAEIGQIMDRQSKYTEHRAECVLALNKLRG